MKMGIEGIVKNFALCDQFVFFFLIIIFDSLNLQQKFNGPLFCVKGGGDEGRRCR